MGAFSLIQHLLITLWPPLLVPQIYCNAVSSHGLCYSKHRRICCSVAVLLVHIPVKREKLIPGNMALAVLQAWSPTGAKPWAWLLLVALERLDGSTLSGKHMAGALLGSDVAVVQLKAATKQQKPFLLVNVLNSQICFHNFHLHRPAFCRWKLQCQFHRYVWLAECTSLNSESSTLVH